MDVGRNDRCPCGSGLKFKKCHFGKPLYVPPDPFKERSIKDRNIILINAITDIFFGKGEDWDEMRHSLTEDKVRELYKIVAWLWPPQTDIIPLLPKPDNTLRGLYTGDLKPQDILQNVVRYSLYTEEILIVSPFLNPLNMRPEFSPLHNPKQYRQDTLELIYFALALAPWIEAGIVNMIPDPMDFDFKLRKEIYSMADGRYQANMPFYEAYLKDYVNDEGKEDLRRMYMRAPVEFMRKRFKESKPEATQEEIDATVEYFLRQRKANPLLLDEEASGEAEMMIKRMSANLEL